MELVSKKYKQTEIGIIPSDWKMKTLGDLGEVKMCRRVFNSQTQSEGEIPFYKIGTFGEEADAYISKELYENFRQRFSFPKKGDILISAAGTIGRTVIYDGEPSYFQDSNIVWIDNSENIVSNEFLYHLFKVVKYNTEGGTIQRLYNSILKDAKFACPSNKEQTAIATALSDADNYISSLEKLIGKKRLIKQGAMQRLLTPKENWVMKKLGEVFNISGGYSATREQLSQDDGFCYLHYGDIHGSAKTYIDCDSQFAEIPKLKIDINKIARKSLLENGDIVFVDASEDDEGVSRHIVIDNKENIPFISGLHTIVAKSKDSEFDNGYKRYCFQSKYIKDQFKYYAVGTKVSGISKSNIKNINISVPPMAEQTKIATTLSDMDEELSVLERQLTKAQNIKQGMMQQLLTGKIRLV